MVSSQVRICEYKLIYIMFCEHTSIFSYELIYVFIWESSHNCEYFCKYKANHSVKSSYFYTIDIWHSI